MTYSYIKKDTFSEFQMIRVVSSAHDLKDTLFSFDLLPS